MGPHEIFQLYASERKLTAPAGYQLEQIDHLTRLTPVAPNLDGVIMFSELSEASADAAISTQIYYFSGLGRPFEWKVYSFDSPPDLSDRLKAKGFTAGDTEAFMVYPVDACPDMITDESIRVDRVTSEAGVDDVISVQQEVWAQPFPWLKRSLCASMEKTSTFCAYVDGAPVGTGWIEFPKRSSFAELHGGAVLPHARGRGVYSALFLARTLEARARRFQFIAVDAAPLSRPILLRKGFRYVCDTVPYRSNG